MEIDWYYIYFNSLKCEHVYIIQVFYHRRPQKHIMKTEKTVLNTRYTISHFLKRTENYQLFPLLNTNIYPSTSPSSCSINRMPISHHTHTYGSFTWLRHSMSADIENNSRPYHSALQVFQEPLLNWLAPVCPPSSCGSICVGRANHHLFAF